MSDDKFTRTSNVLHYKSSLDRIATLSGPDQAQRACDETFAEALRLGEPLLSQLPPELIKGGDSWQGSLPSGESEHQVTDVSLSPPYRAPESDGA